MIDSSLKMQTKVFNSGDKLNIERERTFINNQVAQIVGLTPRQVIDWTQRGLVTPFIETSGAGVKREYNYLNLMEFALCKELDNMGLEFQEIKAILDYGWVGFHIKGWIESHLTISFTMIKYTLEGKGEKTDRTDNDLLAGIDKSKIKNIEERTKKIRSLLILTRDKYGKRATGIFNQTPELDDDSQLGKYLDNLLSKIAIGGIIIINLLEIKTRIDAALVGLKE